MMSREKWSSEPELLRRKRSDKGDRATGNWISRHLSFKKKRPGQQEDASMSPKEPVRTTSSPMLLTNEKTPPGSPAPMRRPSCIDGVVPINIPKLRFPAEKGGRKTGMIPLSEEESHPQLEPPMILKTDFDEEKSKENQKEEAQSEEDNNRITSKGHDESKCPRSAKVGGWL